MRSGDHQCSSVDGLGCERDLHPFRVPSQPYKRASVSVVLVPAIKKPDATGSFQAGQEEGERADFRANKLLRRTGETLEPIYDQ
jgi:hypothetical protein